MRKYFALVPGKLKDQTVRSQFIGDRGDGLRGSTEDLTIGEHAVTHFKTIQQIAGFSELECTLETGRTNQIRIHLAQAGASFHQEGADTTAAVMRLSEPVTFVFIGRRNSMP